MNNRIIRPGQIFNNLFMLTTIVMVCMMSVVSFSTAFADAHEMEGETAEEEPMAEKPKVTGWFQIDVDSLGTYFWVGASH